MPTREQEKIVQQVTTYLVKQSDVVIAYVFGSLVTGPFRSRSDVDVAVVLAGWGDKVMRFERRLELEIALQRVIGRPVHVVDLELAHPFLQHQVRKTGCLIVDKDPARRVRLELDARRRYFDMLPVYRLRRQLALKLLEARHG